MADPQSPFALFRPLLPDPLGDLNAWPTPTVLDLHDVLSRLLMLVYHLVGVSRSALEAQNETVIDFEVLEGVSSSLFLVQEYLRIAKHLETSLFQQRAVPGRTPDA